MSGFRAPIGFEEALRPPIDIRRARLTPAVLRPGSRTGDELGTGPSWGGRDQLRRVAQRVPEVMVKITGRTRDAGHFSQHLSYISRNGTLALEGPDGETLVGRSDLRTLTEDWAAELKVAGQRRDAPLSLSIVLSMPAGTDALRLQDAARAFASQTFGERYPYVFALHTDDRHPHVHLTVRALGRDGERLNPRKADLQLWRETFAAALRDRKIVAEATPRRARGVVRKPERTPVRKLRERFEAGKGAVPEVLRGAYREASVQQSDEAPWEVAIRKRQARIRQQLVVETLRLRHSQSAEDRRLADELERFVRSLPAIATRRQILARALTPDRTPPSPTPLRSRSRS